MARHTGTTDLDPRSTTMLSTAELDRLQAALGACRAHGCDCTSYEAAGKVGNYPTCKCGHSENVHNHSDGEAKPRKRKASLITCTRCPRPAVWRVLGPYAGDTSTVRCEEHLAQAKAQWPDAIVQPLDDDVFFAQGSRRITWTVSPEDDQVYISEPINGLVGIVEGSDVVSTTSDYDLPTRNTWLWSVEEDQSGRTVATGRSAFEGSARDEAERVMRGSRQGSRKTEGSRKTAAWSAADVVPGKGSWEGSPLYPDGTPIHINDRVLDGHGRPGQVVSIVPDESWRVPGEGPIGVRPDEDEYDPAPAPTYWPHDLTPVNTVYQHHPEGYPRLSLGQARHTALGETRMPAEVDTLREDSCPICGADDYRGDTCNSCGFVRPPVIFHDPDTQKARVEDLREPPTPVDLACNACGAVFPATTEQTATASRHHAAIPEELEKGKATGTTTDQSDPQTTSEPEQAEPTAAEQVRQHQQGDLCPSCGKGTLMPKSEVNGVEADEAPGEQGVPGDPVTTDDHDLGGGSAGNYTILPKNDPEAALNLLKGGGKVVAHRRTAATPTIPPVDEQPKKKKKEPTAPKAAPEPEKAPEAEKAPEVEQAPTAEQAPQAEVATEPNPVEADPAATEVTVEEPAEDEATAEESEGAPADEAPTEVVPGDGVPDSETDYEMGRSGLGRALLEDGFSMRDPSGVGPSGGYMVALDKSTETTFPLDTTTAEDIASYYDKFEELLSDPSKYLGGWVEGGQLYLDISTNIEDQDEARRLAAENDQIAIWDVGGGKSVYTEETPQQVAAALTRRLLSYRRPVRCAPTGTERVEEPIPHRLSGRTQKEQSMSTQNPERGGDPRRQPRPQRRQASAEGRPQRPRQGLHQTLSAMEQRMDRMASVIQRQAGEIKELRTGTRVLAAQNEVLRTAALALSETDGSEAALKATAGLRKAAEQGGAKNGEDVALTDESAAAPEATTSVDSDETVATGDVTPDATTDVENTQVAEDQGALNELTDVTQAHTQTGDATGEVQVQKSAPASDAVANPIEESGWTTASKADSDDERTWAAMHLASVRKSAGLTNEETMVLAQRLTKDASITVEAMETEAKTLEQVMATKEGSRRPGRNLVPRRADGGAAPSLAGARTASAEEPSGGDVDVSDAFI